MDEDSVLSLRAVRREAARGAMAGRLRAELFCSLRRSDQRRRAEQYLNGLLEAEGRKTIRNIAAHIGGNACEQALHHFIGSSTWDWRPVYAAIARRLVHHRPPAAWVVRSLPIPKAGSHSVGVGRQMVGEHAQIFNGQLAFGTWYATEELSAPVHWRLFLPETWLGDEARRLRAEIPDDAVAQTPDQCAVSAALEGARSADTERRPIVLDTRVARPAALARSLTDSGIPLLTRVDRATSLAVADAAMPGSGGGFRPAQRIVESVKGLRRTVTWRDSATGRMHTGQAVAVRVRAPYPDGGADPAGRPDLLLIGQWHDPQRPPAELWLTNLVDAPLGSLLRLTKLTHRVAHDMETVGGPVGLRDYEGRAFRGWHRHMALASAAWAVSALEAAQQTRHPFTGGPVRERPLVPMSA